MKNSMILAVMLPLIVNSAVSSPSVSPGPTMIFSKVTELTFISGIDEKVRYSKAKSGVEKFKKSDGRCFQIEYFVHEIREVKTILGPIEVPVTSEVNKEISCFDGYEA